jgi:hypothetical protein
MNNLPDPFYIMLLNMPAIFPKMKGDLIRACLFYQDSCMDRIRLDPSARLAKGCYMVEIYPEADSNHFPRISGGSGT